MSLVKISSVFSVLVLVLIFGQSLKAQDRTDFEVLTDKDQIKKIVPTSFYFAGQSAPTQMRNAAVAKIGEDHYIISGLVDTSGYSAEISGKYEGFFITDSPVQIGNKELNTGAYGFGFSKEGVVKFFDLSSKELFSVSTTNDADLKRPRPLMMMSENNGVRFYKGRTYVVISRK